MAQLNDTQINGNLNVTEDVQIGDMSVTEKLDELNTNISDINIRDYIVEQGISGIWTYRKWNSGIAELWARGVNIKAAKDDNQSVSAYNNIELPFIIYNRNCQVSAFGNAWKLGRIYHNDNFGQNTTTMLIVCYLDYTSHSLLTATDQYINIYVTGKWK